MSTIANAIIGNVVSSLLNWDDEVVPTPVDDFLENIKTVVSKYAGWDQISAELTANVLTVSCASVRGDCGYTLMYDIASHREISGRLFGLGLHRYIDEIETMVRH
jgi:hypothetical protein